MKTQPVARHEEDDLFIKSFYWVLGLIGKALRYLGRRAIQNPLVGLLYLVMAFPAAFLILQHLRLVWATATARPFTQPAPVWPLSEPVQPVGLVFLLLAIISVVAFDRWTVLRAARSAAKPKSDSTPVGIDDWVLGRTYERSWNPDPGEFELKETSNLYRLREEHLRTHMIIVAPPGGGKTRSVLKPALQMFKRTGAAVLCIDAKGTDFDPDYFHLNFNIDNPEGSMRLNVWSGHMPQEMAERLAEALVPDVGPAKRYFSDNAKIALTGLVVAYHAVYGEMPSLQQLLTYLRNPKTREDLAEELHQTGLSDKSPEIIGLHKIDDLAKQKYDALGTLDTALAPLALGEVAPLLSTARYGYSIEQLLKQPLRVRFALPVGPRPALAPLIGRLVLAQFTHAVISPHSNRAIPKAAVVDEAGSFVTRAIATGMSMARENRGCYILAVQNLSQIEDPTLRENVLSVSGNKMVMPGVGDFDAKKFSALFGSRERLYTTHNQSTSEGSQRSHSRGSGQGSGDLFNPAVGGGGSRQQSTRGRGSSHQQSEGSSRQMRERAEFLTGEIRGLPQFHALIERRDSRGKMTPATIIHLDIETIEDTVTAQALRLYKETGRLEATVPQLPPLRGRQVVTLEAIPAIHNTLPSELPEHVEADPQEAAGEQDRTGHGVGVKASPTAPEEPSTPGGNQPASEPEGYAETTTPMPEWVQEAVQLLVHRLRLTREEAQVLVYQARNNGRDAAYLRDILEYAARAPSVENGAELFRHMIKGNKDCSLSPRVAIVPTENACSKPIDGPQALEEADT